MRVVTWTSSARSHFGHFEDFFCTASLCSGHGFIRPAASGSVFWQNCCSCAWLPGSLHAQGGDVRKFLQVDLENINSPSCWGKIKLNIFEIMHADLTCQSTTKKSKVAALSGPAGVVHPKGVTPQTARTALSRIHQTYEIVSKQGSLLAHATAQAIIASLAIIWPPSTWAVRPERMVPSLVIAQVP